MARRLWKSMIFFKSSAYKYGCCLESSNSLALRTEVVHPLDRAF